MTRILIADDQVVVSAGFRAILARGHPNARGRSNAELADELIVSVPTVKTHVASIVTKLGLRDRAQAVVVAYESGLVRPGKG